MVEYHLIWQFHQRQATEQSKNPKVRIHWWRCPQSPVGLAPAISFNTLTVGLHRSNRRNQGQSVQVMTFLTVRISSSTDLQSTQVEFQLQALPSSTPSRLLHCNQIRVTIDRAIRHLTFNYQSLLTCVLLHSILANLLSRYKSCHG